MVKVNCLLILCVTLWFSGCEKGQPASSINTQDGHKRISLTDQTLFQGDLSRYQGFSDFYNFYRKSSELPPASVSAKAFSKIQFKEARVVVLNLFAEHKYFNSVGYEEFECELTQANYRAFHGKSLDNWDELLEGLNQYGRLNIVYTGILQKSGDYLEGEVLVEPGMNTVVVFYIDNAGKIIWTSYADYLYMSDVWREVAPDDIHSVKDGWVESYEHQYNPQVDPFWFDCAYYSYRLSPSDTCYFPPVTVYYLPALGSAGYLGLSKEYADTKCGICIDTTHQVTSSSWKSLGTDGFSLGVASLISMKFPSSGMPYVAYRDAGYGNKAIVRQWNGTQWELTGGTPVSVGSVKALSLAMANNYPFVGFVDSASSDRVTIKRWNTSSWMTVGSASLPTIGVNEMAMAVNSVNSYVYAGFTDPGQSNGLTVMRFNNTRWDTLGNPGFSPGSITMPALAVNSQGDVYAAFKDWYNSSRITVMRYDIGADTGWALLGGAGFSANTANFINLAFSSVNDTPYVAYDDGSVWVKKWNGSSWLTVGGSPVSYNASGGISLAVSCGSVSVGISDGSGYNYYAGAYKLTTTDSWTTIGLYNGISAGSIGYPCLVNSVSSCVPYFAYQDGNASVVNGITVKYYAP